MHVLASLIVVQSLLQAVQMPVLEFPEAGLDDPAAYEGYATRFFRDSHRNAFQVYLDTRSPCEPGSRAARLRGPDGDELG